MGFLEFVKPLVKANIDFLINASRLEMLFNTNISLALLHGLRSNTLRYTLLCSTRSLENIAFCIKSKNKDNESRTETLT